MQGCIISLVPQDWHHEADPYATLGVGYAATDAELRAAFLKLSRPLHPDRPSLPGGQQSARLPFR